MLWVGALLLLLSQRFFVSSATSRAVYAIIDANMDYAAAVATNFLFEVQYIMDVLRCAILCMANDHCLTAVYYGHTTKCRLFAEYALLGTRALSFNNATILSMVDRGKSWCSTNAYVQLVSALRFFPAGAPY